MKAIYRIEGMHCTSCIDKITFALSPHVRVIEATFNPPMLQLEAEAPPSLEELNAYLSAAGNYHLQPVDANKETPKGLWTYYPIFLITAYIIGVASINNLHAQGINWLSWMNQFMAGFFLIFSAFKLLDIRSFAEGYSTYDLLAQRWRY